MKLFCALIALLALASGCSGGPIKEKPIFEPPPFSEVPADPPPPEGPGPSLETEAPSPPPARPEPPGAPVVFGVWTSASLKGPGSASFQRVDLIFRRDGRYVAVAEGKARASVVTGRFTVADGSLCVESDGGDVWEFGCRFEGPNLVLVEGDSELRLHRFAE